MPTDNVIQLKPTRPCPICGKPSVAAFEPFCSVRCANVDLNRWLTGAYVIPGPPLAPGAGAADDALPTGLDDEDGDD